MHAALTKGDTSAAAFDAYGKRYCAGIESMRRLVYAFYDEKTNYGHFIRKYPDLKADLTDCIIGAVDKDFTALFKAFSEFAQIPPVLDFGGPLYPERAAPAMASRAISITASTDKRCVTVDGKDRCKVAIQTNNVETDDRGYIYIVDRANTGMHILELTGPARAAAGLP